MATTDRRLIKANKTTYKGKKFQSRLESYMFKLLDDNGIDARYEEESFTIINSFYFPFSSYEKTLGSSSKILLDKGNKTHLGIKYTPDFIIKNGEQQIIIECKGLATDVFSMRFKLFKKWCIDTNKDVVIFVPRNQSQCDFTLKEIQKILTPSN